MYISGWNDEIFFLVTFAYFVCKHINKGLKMTWKCIWKWCWLPWDWITDFKICGAIQRISKKNLLVHSSLDTYRYIFFNFGSVWFDVQSLDSRRFFFGKTGLTWNNRTYIHLVSFPNYCFWLIVRIYIDKV